MSRERGTRPEGVDPAHLPGDGAAEDCQTAPPSAGPPAGVKANAGADRIAVATLGSQASGQARLEAFLKVFHSDDRVLVVISADPDAIASAVAVKRILWRRVAQVTVASVNHVKRPDNLQLLETLKLKLEALHCLDLAAFSRLVMVDSQPRHSPRTELLPFDAIIDHHPPAPLSGRVPAPGFIDLRTDLGATATMMAGYLKAAKIKPNHRLATALFYAIKTDTQNFVRQGQLEDMKAFRWLYPLIQPPLLADIERAPIARSSFKSILNGLNETVFHHNRAHAFLGRADHADTLVIVADFLIQIKEINRVVVAGLCGEKLVIIFRGGGIRQDVGRLAAAAFGKYGSAGGHKNMARAEIPLANLDPKIRDNLAAIHRFILRHLSDSGRKADPPARTETER